MSRFFRVTRERWAVREMVLHRWRKPPLQLAKPGEAICELLVNGDIYTVNAPHDDTWGIYTHFIPEDEEVGPWGELFEYSDSGFLPSAASLQQRGFVFRRFPYRRRDSYPRVFLNYRRDDSEAYAGRLHETLVGQFGIDDVFMDQFSIRPGEPFPWAVQQSVAHCGVLIALIGPKWLDVRDAHGKRRLDSEYDSVRREITAALDRGISLMPVLLPGASIPDVVNLPDEMRGMEQLQMLDLSARHWKADIERLLASVTEALAAGSRVS